MLCKQKKRQNDTLSQKLHNVAKERRIGCMNQLENPKRENSGQIHFGVKFVEINLIYQRPYSELVWFNISLDT